MDAPNAAAMAQRAIRGEDFASPTSSDGRSERVEAGKSALTR
jgi:hypothetical protein